MSGSDPAYVLVVARALASLTLIAGLVVSLGGTAGAAADPNYQPLPVAVVHDLAVPIATLAAVGPGKPDGQANQAPRVSSSNKISEGGKPEVAYVLGEFCPFCAGESWAVAVALSRFGTFNNLETLTSSAVDTPPSIQTISFRHATFASRYVVFDAIVNEDTRFKKVEPVPANVRPAWNKGHDEYPFIDFGGRAELTTSSFSPTLLKGVSRMQIATDLAHPGRPVAQAIDGTANQLTAAICLATDNAPRKVCGSKAITAIQGSLKR
jgi:hypothetical protein